MNKYDVPELNTHDLDPWQIRDTLSLPVLKEALSSYKGKDMTQITSASTRTNPAQSPTHGLGRASIRAADRSIKKQALATLVSDYDLNFVYVRDKVEVLNEYFMDWVEEVNPKGGVVLAYRIPKNGGTVLEVASSVCSNKDLFDKLEGKFRAANNFASGKAMLVKIRPGGKYGQQLLRMFTL